ncbi:unnamed protein product [Rangifer tarandus platyrhynchus]|uniref:Uncharacterized protein n=1 Tax=Rangifer tarandus platyrhynchus TaxID=3082113 RepID=A0AC59ZRZ0_RANTA
MRGRRRARTAPLPAGCGGVRGQQGRRPRDSSVRLLGPQAVRRGRPSCPTGVWDGPGGGGAPRGAHVVPPGAATAPPPQRGRPRRPLAAAGEGYAALQSRLRTTRHAAPSGLRRGHTCYVTVKPAARVRVPGTHVWVWWGLRAPPRPARSDREQTLGR